MTRVAAGALADVIRAAAVGRDGRLLVAIAGPPGAGKTTLAEHLAHDLGPDAAAVPMDGFHLDNSTLNQRGRLPNKGAPDTFDVDGFAALVRQVAQGGACDYPTFDRVSDAVVPGGASLQADTRIVLFEGNYLLLQSGGWEQLAPLWDITALIEVPIAELRRRLIQRWIDHGHTPQEARERAERNDIANAEIVISRSAKPDFLVSQD